MHDDVKGSSEGAHHYRLYRTRERGELIGLTILCIVLWVVAANVDAFEEIYEITRAYESYEIDEFITLLVLLPLFVAIFAVRRMVDLRFYINKVIKSECRVAHMALHDSLTGLPNRLFLHQQLKREIERLKRTHGAVAVMMIDLDRFKDVNDIYGHGAGDALLMDVAARIRDIVRKTDIAARFGGDEFVIVQVDSSQPNSAGVLAQRLINALEQPFNIYDKEIRIGCSIGIAVGRGWVRTAEDLIRCADMAVYRVKESGRNHFAFFEENMEEQLRRKQELEQSLRIALQDGQFALHFQPIVDLEKPVSLLGFEALLRWQHPERGLVPPSEFVPIAEETGAIIDIGRWVIRAACETAAKWPDHLKVAINISPIQFRQGDIVQDFDTTFSRTGIDPKRVQVEITETSLIENADIARNIISALKDRGIQVVMDDFGTGYSSLGYLRSFPIDKIKIDRSFVSGAVSNAEDRAIVQAVVDIGRALGLRTTGEGAEDEQTLALLLQKGCSEAQGYYLGRPTDAPNTGSDYSVLEAARTEPATEAPADVNRRRHGLPPAERKASAARKAAPGEPALDGGRRSSGSASFGSDSREEQTVP